MEAVAGSVIDRIVGLLITPITRGCGYWVFSGKNVEAMNEKTTRFNAAVENVKKQTEGYVGSELPAPVSTWLADVEDIQKKAATIPRDGIGIGCSNIITRYKAGKDSSDVVKEMDERLKGMPQFKPKEKILAIVDTKNHASTSGTADDGNGDSFETRDVIFKKALECLESKNSKTHMIALSGMGGVGKSHMMERLKNVAATNMFKRVVKVVLGQNTDLNALQHALAEKTGGPLIETTRDARAERLKTRFVGMSNDGEKKILVILDDLWEEVDLQDIGLTSPLPNGFKLLITSRKTNVCTKMGVDTDAIFNIGSLNDDEAKTLFFDTAGLSKNNDPNLNRIGEEIIKCCGNLPIALKLIASSLRGKENKEAATNLALLRLQRHELKGHYEIVHSAFEISFKDLKTNEEKALFLLSGLFPDDFDIPIEELIRYGWGLKLFSEVFTFAEARLQVENWVQELISTNLLAKSDRVGCVKMHDLARAFALSDSIEVKQASIVNVHDILKQHTQAKSYQRILLKCSGVSEFPKDFGFPNLAFLKLIMDGDEHLKLTEAFYKSMEKLEVLSYEEIQCPLLPVSTNLRTLCLHGCKFTSDWSAIKKLVQLEVLSFAGSGIIKLPSEVGELKKLRLLDLTGCSADLCIDNGVLEGLSSLEELYIKVSGEKAISFTKDIFDELKAISVKLSALQVEFFHKEALPKNMSFTKLERFKISMGCLLEEDKDIYSFKNTLKLVTRRSDLVESNINELFRKTEKLHLQVKGMKHLMDVTAPSSQPCFSKLRELEVSDCADLTFLFPTDVACGLTNLERLTVSSCHVLGTLIQCESGYQGSVIEFPKLKFLSLKELPHLMSLCETDNRVELQKLVELRLDGLPEFTSIYPDDTMQSFIKPQVEIPKLEKLEIYSMKNLKQIWPPRKISTNNEEVVNNVSTVSVVKVKGCDRLVNLFPTNPMPLLNKLKKLQVKECGSIEVLFNIDLGPPRGDGLAVQRSNPICGCWPWNGPVQDPSGLVTPPEENIGLGCVGKVEEVSCKLRSIRVEKLGKIEVLWKINGANNSHLLSCFQSVENIHIHGCKRFSNIFTPTTADFNIKAFVDIRIQDSRDLVFNKALKSLEPDGKTRMIALCGVGKVGKTTLMKDLVVAAKDLRMFDLVVKLVVGRETDPFYFQETIAKCIDEVLRGEDKEERAKLLCRKFMQKSHGANSKILVILDDLRQKMDLKGIGLPDPLPNGVKLLITSRDENVCTQMGVEKSSIFIVPLLRGPEAKVLFYQTLRPSDDDAAADPELQKIAEDVVRICCGMPFLIKEVASFLIRDEARSTWEDAYFNLKKNQLNLIYKRWYEQLETDDARTILLLSGFFPEEADISVEDLVRYGWGLKLFNDEVDTLAKARQRIKNSIDVLTRANMLVRSHHVGRVKMHHALRGFVFSNLTKVKQALIEHDNILKDPKEPYERILLNCTGMSKFPVDFNYRSLRLLKLMGEQKLVEFPHNFYDKMKNLEVVAYERMDDPYPLLPQYSTNLRTLCLDSCSLTGDFSFLGNLTSLEILSFAHSGIQKLPSTIGKLKRLKVLDVTGCPHLSIDEGVFGGLDKLEELYLRVHGSKAVRFTNTNCDELNIISPQLFALEVELYENKLVPEYLSFEKLERFKISMGCLLDDTDIDPSKNTLRLGTRHNELLQSRIDESLIKKTDRLCLQIKDMKNLEQVSVQYSFCNLKELEITECADLMFLFTVPVASGFTELECLKVSSCPVLETLIHAETEGSRSVIMFPKLQSLFLKKLPSLTSLCDTDNRVELRQLVKLSLDNLPNITTIFPDVAKQPNAFFNKQVVIPKLERLKFFSMEKLKQIWPCEITTNNSEDEVNHIFVVRVVEVQGCDSLVNLFPSYPMPLLLTLEKLKVKDCGSIKVLFNIDLGRVGETEQVSSLRSIHAVNLRKLAQVWKINGANNSRPISGFKAVKNIRIHECLSFKDIFTPQSTNFDMTAVVDIKMQKSRDLIFDEALKSLEPESSKTNMIALCGMGGMGKSHMMERLTKHVKYTNMFNCVVKVVVGSDTDLIALQNALAEQTGGALKETTSDARAERLKTKFAGMSKDGEKKILVILDDLWEAVDLQDIGLTSPLPNGFKLLITSRMASVCMKMGVDTHAIFNIGALNDDEAKSLFFATVGLSKDYDPILYKLGEEIIKMCVNMPLALKVIASTLKMKDESLWQHVLSSLQSRHNGVHGDLDATIYEFLKKSYDHLKKDEQAIFLLSGLFPEDSDIPVEELMRYAWGLKLLSNVNSTLAKARRQVEVCVNKLISAKFLQEGDHVGCVRMHDLVRDFALSNLTEVNQASIVNHHDISKQLTRDANESYQRILLKCTDISEFPKDYNCPNLRFLKLMDGDEQLKVPEDLYENMKNLEVLSYEKMQYPLLPRSVRCSTYLRTLCLSGCTLISDWSSIGDFLNLEVLSFADCCIRNLPSAMGKLKKLKLLDLTGCSADLCIDDGVLEGLVSLEELYIKVSGHKAIRLTDANYDELEVLLMKLSALEFEFFENKTQPRNMSFKNLERFKISIGCQLEDDKDIHSFKNTLKLITERSDLLGCKINELFENTDQLHLQVKDMKQLQDVTMSPQHSFSKLRVLVVDECKDLRYLFTDSMATDLRKLEILKVSSCPVLDTLIHGESGGWGSVILFPKLKFLSLKELPSLMSLCDTDDRVELQQLAELRLDGLPNITTVFPDNSMQQYAFFNNQVQIPKLEELGIFNMEKLMQIWPREITATSSEKEVNSISMLGKIEVRGCESLVNIFPCNPLPLLHHLEELHVYNCCSIKVLFNLDLNSAGAGNIYELTSSLRLIHVEGLENVGEIWRIEGGGNNNSSSGLPHIPCFKAVEKIYIRNCPGFRDIFSPKNIKLEMRADVTRSDD